MDIDQWGPTELWILSGATYWLLRHKDIITKAAAKNRRFEMLYFGNGPFIRTLLLILHILMGPLCYIFFIIKKIEQKK